MTPYHPDLTIRHLDGPAEVDLFNRIPYTLSREIAGDLAAGRRHPHWLWIAQRGGHVVARAGWWSRPGEEHPMLMDVFDVAGDVEDAIRLLETALPSVSPPVPYTRFFDPGARPDPRAVAALERMGLKIFVERLRLEWRPGTPVAAPRDRLLLRPVRDPGELIDLMTLVLDGTLDAHSREELTRVTARESAEAQYHEELARYPSPPDWWRIATLPDGEPAGFVIPAHNGYHPIIAYIGVTPSHRGHGYIDDLLAEGTRLLAARGVPRIRAATDVGNRPMAAAFDRAGYVVFERQIDMTWS